jgi:glucose/arabinose dehydrogenase
MVRFVLSLFLVFPLGVAEQTKGKEVFEQRCALCHQAQGQGVKGIFPPLAGSDWLKNKRQESLLALLQGLAGSVVVNGENYNGAMPAQALTDSEVAAVMNFVGSSWGNELPAFSEEEVRAARAKSKFPNYESLQAASAFHDLPKAPAGYSIREVGRLPENEFGTRLAGNSEHVFVLTQMGVVWKLDLESGAFEQIIKPEDYLDLGRAAVSAMGIMLSPQNELWISTNQGPLWGDGVPMHEISIFRASLDHAGRSTKIRNWFRHSYPSGSDFNHGVSNLALGPDGKLYLSSGARTDGGEKPNNHPDTPTGEVESTAAVLRFDPAAENPKFEVFARGLRNVYGFAWDDEGKLFSVANGPNANPPEEMDVLEFGKHYGFPYQFSDWPIQKGKPYAYTPVAPENLQFTMPVKNLGPDGGAKLATFDPHSSPAGMIWCDSTWPAPLGGTFLITRYGNVLGSEKTGIEKDVGFDLLSVRVRQNARREWTAETHTVLAPLGRPIDILKIGPGRALILEYTRATNFKDGLAWLSGRILELRAVNSR